MWLIFTANMKQEYTIASNGTWLSLAHAKILKETILFHFPTLAVNVITTQNIEADFKTYNLKGFTIKDSEDLPYTFIQKGDIRNIAFFNKNIADKIVNGKPLKIAIDENLPHVLFEMFLQKGLPKLGETVANVQLVFINSEIENVLENKDLDGYILPLANINDLLKYEPFQTKLKAIIADKNWMLLPLLECPPLAGQGVVVATANPLNLDAVSILKKCNHIKIEATFRTEKNLEATLINTANHGIFNLKTDTTNFSFAAGVDKAGNPFTNWDFEIPDNLNSGLLFSSTDYMKDFFSYQYLHNSAICETSTSVFISSHKAIHSTELFNVISQKSVWAAGTRTWYALAKKGIWVAGCADGLGMESLQSVWQSPLINITKKNLLIITNKASTLHWKADGWNTAATYELIPEPSATIQEAIRKTDCIFWTSFQQYEMYKDHVQPKTKHLCPAGKTAKLLLAAGCTPVIFPTIKAFLDWVNKI